jgi:hypothetical protein
VSQVHASSISFFSAPSANHWRGPRTEHPVPCRAALAAAAHAAHRRRHGGGDLLAAIPIVIDLHLPEDAEEGVDIATGQRERALRGVPVLPLAVVEEPPEQRVVGALGAHHEPLPLGTHVHGEVPRHRRRGAAAAGALPGPAPVQGPRYQDLRPPGLARRPRHEGSGLIFFLAYMETAGPRKVNI